MLGSYQKVGWVPNSSQELDIVFGLFQVDPDLVNVGAQRLGVNVANGVKNCKRSLEIFL